MHTLVSFVRLGLHVPKPSRQPYMGLFLEDLAFANANYDTGLGMLSEPGLKYAPLPRPPALSTLSIANRLTKPTLSGCMR